MKHSIALIFFAILLASCGKTTTGKLEGDWEITCYEFESTTINGSDSVYTYTSFNDSTHIFGVESNVNTSFEINPEMIEASFLIKKDGTWSRNMQYTYLDPSANTTISVTEEHSGSWNFIKEKDNDYQKNERVLFSTQATSLELRDGETLIDYSEATYADSPPVEIFTVLKSKKSSLDLNFESYSSFAEASQPQEKVLRKFYSLKQ